MFSVKLQIPCQNKDESLPVVHDKNLDQIFHSCRVHMVNPNFSSGSQLERLSFARCASENRLLPLNVFELGARFNYHVVCEDPSALNLIPSFLQSFKGVFVVILQRNGLFTRLDLFSEHLFLVKFTICVEIDQVSFFPGHVVLLGEHSTKHGCLLFLIFWLGILLSFSRIAYLHENFEFTIGVNLTTAHNCALIHDTFVINGDHSLVFDLLFDHWVEFILIRKEFPGCFSEEVRGLLKFKDIKAGSLFTS